MADGFKSRILGIDHVQITIPPGDEAERIARSFYTDLMGLPEVPKPRELAGRGGFWLEVGNRAVHVGVEENPHRHQRRDHVAYKVDDLDAWREYLAEHDVEIIESIQYSGSTRFEFRDPFGNRVELIQPT